MGIKNKLLILSLALIASANAQKEPFKDAYGLERARIIKNKIKTITIYAFNGDTASRGIKLWYRSYNETSDPLIDEQYSFGGDLEMRTIYYYNKAGLCIADTSKQFDWSGDGSVEYLTVTSYDAQGHQIRSTEYDTGRVKEIDTYQYDKNGNLIKNEMLDADSTLIYFAIYKYDSKKRQILDSAMTSDIDENGERHFFQDHRYIHFYNESKHFMVTQGYTWGNKASGRDTSKYDANWNLTEYSAYDAISGKLRSKQIFQYDKEGNELKFNNIKFTYDKKGNPTEEDEYSPNGAIKQRKKYYYDFY